MCNELSTPVYSTKDSSGEITLLFYQILTYTIYIQTGCKGKIINIYSHTRPNTVALLTYYEDTVFWKITFDCKKSLFSHCCCLFWIVCVLNNWRFFLVCNITAITLRWYFTLYLWQKILKTWAVWLVNIPLLVLWYSWLDIRKIDWFELDSNNSIKDPSLLF